MADYIYLLQNRLTPAQGRALQAVREAARSRGVTVFLVGGAVRDLSSGAPVRDLDFAVQGDEVGVVEALAALGAVVSGRNEVLSATYLTLPGGVRVEIGPTLSVTYPQPGKPETQPATILDDLRRRDFTANAMAISLNEGSYGLLLDPLNGIADLENRELRLVSNYGFIEQPSLLLRAARLTNRLGWNLEERTAGRYQTGKEENYIAALPAGERGYELEEIFHEEDPLFTLEHMEAEGWRDVLIPAVLASKVDRNGIDAVRDLIGQLEALGIHPDPAAVYFPLLTGKLPAAETAALKGIFARQGFAEQIDNAEVRGKELASQLTSKAAATPSETWKLLFAAEPAVVLWLAHHSRSSAVQGKFKGFLKEWPQLRQRIPYALMQEMRITPDLPGYDKLLDDLFFALIDGKLDTSEATRAFLEPYSPPAPPPQVNMRRRPAKSARGRSKKVVEDVSAAADDEDEESTPRDRDDDAKPKVREDEDEDEDEEDSVPTPKPPAEKKVAARAAPPKEAKAPEEIPEKVPEKKPAKTPVAHEPAKVVERTPVAAAEVPVAAKAPAKTVAAKAPEPAKPAQLAEKKTALPTALAKKTVGAEPSHAKPTTAAKDAKKPQAPTTKAAVGKKATSGKAAARAPERAAASPAPPAKKSAKKIAPVKAAPKKAVKKSPAKPAPAKKQAARVTASPAKRGVGTKRPAKTAAKGKAKRR